MYHINLPIELRSRAKYLRQQHRANTIGRGLALTFLSIISAALIYLITIAAFACDYSTSM